MCGGATPPCLFYERMDKNEIAWKSHKQAFAEVFSEPGRSGGRLLRLLSGKYVALFGKIPCPLVLGERFCRDAGSGKLICRVNSEFSLGKNQLPPVVWS